MTDKNIVALSIAIVLGTASTAFALEGRDGDNNPIPSHRGFAQRQAPVIGAQIFAGPIFAVSENVRSFNAGNNWDRCVRSARQTCVH